MESLADLTKALGEPDGRGAKFETPWELSVYCPWSAWNCDHAIYWPTQTYDGFAEKCTNIGDWLYIFDDL
jgi:hypothetical protein